VCYTKDVFKKPFLIGLVVLGLFGFSQFAWGAELKTTTILDLKEKQILFRYGGLEKTNIFLCQTTNLSCQNLGSTTPAEVSDPFTDPEPLSTKIKNIKFDRTNATRVTLSPDEKWLAYYDPALANKETERKFVLLNLQANAKRKINEVTSPVNYWDLLTEDLRLFYFSPDSQSLVYLDDRSGYPSLYLVDLGQINKSAPTSQNLLPGKQITQKKYTIADFLLWDANTLYFTANREGAHHWSLYRYDLLTLKLEKIADDISYNQRMHQIDGKLLFLQIKNNSTVPVLYNPATKIISYFPTFPANPPVRGYTEKEIKLGPAGPNQLSGVLMQPANYSTQTRRPLIIWLHGGPYRQVSLGYHSYLGYAIYDWLMGEMAKNGLPGQGALVLKLDYRGSYGYGRTFAESIREQVGQGDVADVTTALTALKKTTKISQVYLVGNSYGGYLALKTIVENPRSFAGAMSINGVMDWFVLLDKLENSIFNTLFGGLLVEKNSDIYYQADIADRIKNLTNQKIVLVQAQADHTVPTSQADYIYDLFVRRNRLATLAKYPGEDHVFKKISSLENICQRLSTMTNLPANCQWSD